MRIMEERPRLEVVDIVCDICGKSCWDKGGLEFECASIVVNWGYHSKKDSERHEIDICESCYDELPFVKAGQVRIYEENKPLNEAARRAATR